MADPDNLDTGQAPWHSHEHTAALLDGLTLKELWDDYGIVGNLTVRCPDHIASCREVPVC